MSFFAFHSYGSDYPKVKRQATVTEARQAYSGYGLIGDIAAKELKMACLSRLAIRRNGNEMPDCRIRAWLIEATAQVPPASPSTKLYDAGDSRKPRPHITFFFEASPRRSFL